MKRPFDYFQAGVLVLNVAEMRKLHSVKEWLEIARTLIISTMIRTFLMRIAREGLNTWAMSGM